MSSYQARHDKSYRQIERLGETGVFDGHQAARSVLVHCAMNEAIVTDYANGLAEGYVMEGVATLESIARKTRLSERSVSRALAYLQELGYIQVTYLREGTRNPIGGIRMTLPEPHLKLVREAR